MCLQRRLKTQRGCNSVVECQLPKLNVAGSNPVTRFGLEVWLNQSNTKTHNSPVEQREKYLARYD